MSEIALRTPQDLAAWVRTPERRAELARALPDGITIDRFERLTTTALLQRPDLIDADQTSLWFALLDAAKRGLAPDGRQGVINVYNTKVKQNGQEVWINKAQFLPMIGGVRDELAEYGWALRTTAVYANDTFHYDIAADRVTHEQNTLGDRGEIVGAWAQVIRMRDGFRLSEVMTRAQIEEVRDQAKAGNSPLWKLRFRQACEKTVGHRLAKKVPLDPKERARILVAIDAEALAPGEAATTFYGPTDSEGTDGNPSSESQPPAEAHTPTPAAAGAPNDEPGLTDDPSDPGTLAETAALYVPPNGKFSANGAHGPKTLAEILELGADGGKWLAWALETITEPAEYREAIWAYANVFAPKLAQEALAKKELS